VTEKQRDDEQIDIVNEIQRETRDKEMERWRDRDRDTWRQISRQRYIET
jgi:hypothetical protein